MLWKNICNLIFRSAILHVDVPFFNVVSQKVVSDINVIWSFVLDGILSHIDYTSVTTHERKIVWIWTPNSTSCCFIQNQHMHSLPIQRTNFRYLKIRLAPFRCSSLGYVWNITHIPTSKKMSGLLVVRYNSDPIMPLYMVWFTSGPALYAHILEFLPMGYQ